MSPAQIEHNISLLLKFGVQKIDISGGEPLLYPHLPYLIDCAQKNGVFVTLTTRGIGTPENKEWVCKNWSKFTRLIISIDAGNKDVCDFYAGCSGVFGQTISFCKKLKKNGCNNLRINTVVNKCILDTQSQQQLMGLINEIAPLEWCLIEPHPANKLPTFTSSPTFTTGCAGAPICITIGIVTDFTSVIRTQGLSCVFFLCGT